MSPSLAQLLLEFCHWCNGSFFGHGIRDSVWLFPFVEIFHLLALGVLGGLVLLLNLRLLGLRFAGTPAAVLWGEVRPWLIGALLVMLASGFLLFSTEAVKMYGNWAFQLKMLLLALAVLFTFTIHRRVLRADPARLPPLVRWACALLCLGLWSGVGLAGRALGYVTTSVGSVS
ncbi:MAG TPA: DUF6644 family protein [Steroidobacteraceae bacterium]|nr:DUF6644 family protein [Steroidobacteraceae bacterium]